MAKKWANTSALPSFMCTSMDGMMNPTRLFLGVSISLYGSTFCVGRWVRLDMNTREVSKYLDVGAEERGVEADAGAGEIQSTMLR